MKSSTRFYNVTVAPAFVTILLLLIPLVAMQISDVVVWDLSDFVVAATLLFGTGFTYQLIARKAISNTYKLAVGLTLATALFLLWSNLAVGLIGSEENPANLMYFGVLAVVLIGASTARFQPLGMETALYVTAFAQGLVTLIALITGLGGQSSAVDIILINGFFIILFVAAALLFRRAHKQ